MNSSVQAILAAIASFSLVTLLFAVILIICRTSTKRYRSPQPPLRPAHRKVGLRSEPSATTIRTSNNSELTSIEISESATFDPNLNRVSMKELLQATADFSPNLIVGDGSFGIVYKAKLSTGVVVAVKKLSPDAFQGFREFRAEMEILGKIRHPNIVKIFGYCATGSERILVYEFIEKGSVDQWLYDTASFLEDSASAVKVMRSPLSWDTRIKIIKGVGKGLAYMHNLDTPIIHRDIKASNILLDTDFEAHIADFGLARRIDGSHTHVSTQAGGTMGYMPPEYISGATKATTIGDVYSFGVLMLEIITGRQPHFPFVGDDGKEIRLVEWVNMLMMQNRYMEMVDANMLGPGDGLEEDVVAKVLGIGVMCVNEMRKLRPRMEEVVDLLDNI